MIEVINQSVLTMGILDGFSTNIILICVGALMLLGTFLTINSRGSSPSDHDFALVLLIAGVICIAVGTGIIDVSKLKEMFPKPGE